MARFRAKQHIVDAMRNDGTDEQIEKIVGWIHSDGGKAWRSSLESLPRDIVIHHREYRFFSVRQGDWVVRAAQGEYFFMLDEHFRMMYKGDWDR